MIAPHPPPPPLVPRRAIRAIRESTIAALPAPHAHPVARDRTTDPAALPPRRTRLRRGVDVLVAPQRERAAVDRAREREREARALGARADGRLERSEKVRRAVDQEKPTRRRAGDAASCRRTERAPRRRPGESAASSSERRSVVSSIRSHPHRRHGTYMTHARRLRRRRSERIRTRAREVHSARNRARLYLEVVERRRRLRDDESRREHRRRRSTSVVPRDGAMRL